MWVQVPSATPLHKSNEKTDKRSEKKVKNIDSLSKTTSGPDYKKVKKWGIIGGACLAAFALLIGFFVIKGNNNVLDIWAPEDLGVEEAEFVESIMLDKESIVLEMNGSEIIKATVHPGKFKESIVWNTSDSSVVSVNNGQVRSVAPGIASVTAESADGYCVARCQVIVQKTAKNTEYEISDTKLSLSPGETAYLSIYKMPAKTYDSTVYWASSNEKIATIQKNGQITALDYGSCVLSAKSRETATVIATCVLTVKADIESVILDPTAATLSEGSTVTLKATVNPANATNKTVTWESANKAIATVDNKGVVKAVAPGTTTITCTTVDGEKKAICNITVQKKVEKVVLSESELLIGINEKQTLTALVWPETIADKSVVWSSSDSSVVSVDEKGAIMAIGYGSATITAAAKTDPSVKDTCKVTVTRNVSGVELNMTTANVLVGKTLQLSANILPASAQNKAVTWTSDSDAVATVSSTGLVTGNNMGMTTIRCKTEDGGFEATCKVTVSQPVNSLSFNKDTITVTVGQVYNEDLKLSVMPDTAKNSVKVYSSDSTIASVTNNGGNLSVKGLAPGVTTIVAESTDGTGKRDTLNVNVNMSGYNAFTTATTPSGELQITGLAADWQNKFPASTVTIPDMVDGKKVVAIANNAFSGQLTGITAVKISENIKTIGENAFYNNPSLKTVTLPDSLTVIQNSAFESTGLLSVTVPKSCASIGSSAFKNCLSLATVKLEKGVSSIGADAFNGDVALTSITIPESVVNIYARAFYNTGLTEITFDTKSMTEITENCFAMTNLARVTIPEGVKFLRDNAFAGNAQLTYVVVPDTVIVYGDKLFENCAALTTIWMSENVQTLGTYTWLGVPDTCTLAATSDSLKQLIAGIGIPDTRIVAKTDALYQQMT